MMSAVLQFIVVFVSFCSLSSAVKFRDPFEEFLRRENELERQNQFVQQLQQAEEALNVGSGSGETSSDFLATATTMDPNAAALAVDLATSMQSNVYPTPTATVPTHRETQTTCCVLGARAARSGFLCNPENYRPMTLMRHEVNQMGNFKVTLVDRYRYQEVRQHAKCVSGAVPALSDEFQRCCKRAFIDTLDVSLVGGDEHDKPILLELPLQMDIARKPKKTPYQKRNKQIAMPQI